MTQLSITAWNYSSNNWSLCTYVGGISAVARTAVGVIPLAWSVAGLPRVQSSGKPGRSDVSWTVNYGFSVMQTGVSGESNWTATSQEDNQPLGTEIDVTYDPIVKVYNLGTPRPCATANILRFNLDKSIPPNPAPSVSIGVNINGVPAAALPSNYFQPNLTVDFQINPTYSVCCAANFLQGDIITGSVMSTAHQVVFSGGAVNKEVSYSSSNTWSDGKNASLELSLSSGSPVARLITHADNTYEVLFFPSSGSNGSGSGSGSGSSNGNGDGGSGGSEGQSNPVRPTQFLFSDDLTTAVAITDAQAEFFSKNIPNAFIFGPSGPNVPVAVGTMVQNIPDTTGDNRGSPWIGFWETNTGLNRTLGCVINTTECTPNSYMGAHMFISGGQWYIINECAYHNHRSRVAPMKANRSGMLAVPISTWVGQVLAAVYKARLTDPNTNVSDIFTPKELAGLRKGK